jgi:predicted CopG family antitoxin
MAETTTITVSDPVWKDLNGRKERGETFDDVLRGVLEIDGTAHESPTEQELQQ